MKLYSVIALAGAFMLVVILMLFTSINFYWVWLISSSLALFFLYGFDKAQAKSGGYRVPEIVLHSLAVAGGFTGGWLGRSIFHHKTRKPVFTVVLAAATILNLVLIGWWYLR
jgi:uncharacterized membrane protein YsdA (DUF1294 family)